MQLIAIILSLVALVAAGLLWLVAAASKLELESKYPDYVKVVYRPSYQVITRQGGPVRMFTLIGTVSPNPREPLIFQMRVLALACVASGVVSALLWALV